MRKLKVLIEGSVLDAVRLIDIVVTVPVEIIIPALVQALQLPETDGAGKKIVYSLHFAKDGQVISEQSTLAEAGVTLGSRLRLERDASSASGNAFVSAVSAGVAAQPRQLPPHFDIHTAVTLVNPEQFTEDLDGNGGQYLDAESPRSERIYDLDDSQMNGRSATIHKRSRSLGRRAFLVSSGLVVGAGAIGLGYVRYQTTINEMVQNLLLRKPAVPATNGVPSARNQSQPQTMNLPTVAQLRFTFTQHKDNTRMVAWSPDGRLLASASDDKHIFIWSPDGAVKLDIPHPAAVRALAWSPDGLRIVTGSNNEVSFFNVQTGERLAHSTRRHTQMITSVAWTAHGRMQVVSGGTDRQAIVWDTQTYRSLTRYTQHAASIDVICWSADGRVVASSSDDGFVRIWNADDGKDIHGSYQDVAKPMRAMAFAPDGTLLAVGGDDGIVRIWSALTCNKGGERCMDAPQKIQVGQQPMRTLAWSPDGRLLAAGGNDGMISVWNLRIQNPRSLLSIKQNDIVRSLAWSPNGKQLAGAWGKSVGIWDVQ